MIPPPPVNQHRIGESEFLDGRGDLRDLSVAVRAAVACVRYERIDLDGFKLIWKFHAFAFLVASAAAR
jgi:hypothetical protein